VRVVTATVFAFVLSKMTAAASSGSTGSDEGYLLVIAFIVGVLPETFLLRLQELARTFVGQKIVGKKGQSLVPLTYELHPLTNLEGIDIYDRARLTDEGVTNIEGLAHHDFVDLLMKTRIPVPRLIDWVDQAILYLHVSGNSGSGDNSDALERLRSYGIRTATDLEETYRAAKKNGTEAAFLAILPNPPGAPHGPPRIQVIVQALADEEWMSGLRHWYRAPIETGVMRYQAAQ
jgi:hypothetical protein